MPDTDAQDLNVSITREAADSDIILACEHASSAIPAEFGGLGLLPAARHSHAAWDPGASAVAQTMSELLDACLVEATVSRLVFDCNRPPSAPDAMPARSEAFDIPGNADLTEAERARRTNLYYAPFQTALAGRMAEKTSPILVTIHSFTPVYNGIPREVEIGILHDHDTRLADALLKTATDHTSANVQRNAPYGPEHGVMHTLKTHALPQGRLNVMIEIRNDLIQTAQQQADMAQMLSGWTSGALEALGIAPRGDRCSG